MLWFMFPQQSSGKRVSRKEKVESTRWQIGSLVTCVPRTFQVIVILTNTGKSTVETISSNVHSATNHSAKLLIWRNTSSFTLERSHISAHNATLQRIMFRFLVLILWNTLERNHISAINVTLLQFTRTIWSSTKESTLGKSLTDAQCASFPVFKLFIWKNTWWGSTQEKSHTDVTNATTLALFLMICSATWEHTLGRSLSSASNATKLTHKITILDDIPENTSRPRSMGQILNIQIQNNDNDTVHSGEILFAEPQVTHKIAPLDDIPENTSRPREKRKIH